MTTPSKRPRTTRNPLFPVNLLDLLIRHSGANHERETIAFSKRRQGAADRLFILLAWRNYMKSFSEKHRDGSPAEWLGLMEGKVSLRKLLSRRLFRHAAPLPKRLRRYYDGQTRTRRFERERRHDLAYAT